MSVVQIVVVSACGLAAIAFLVLIGMAIATHHYVRAAGSAAALTLSLVVGSAAVFPLPANGQGESVEPKPIDQPSARLTEPLGVSPMCAQVTGALEKWNDAYDVVIATREVTDLRWYFEGETSLDLSRNTFEAQVELGDVHDAAGSRYVIEPVLIKKSWKQYLMKTAEDSQDTYWSSPDMPPGSIEGVPVTVRRTDETSC